MSEPAVLITCEHAVNQVPEPWRKLFCAHQELLLSHRGYDPGALVMARVLATALSAPLYTAEVTRLLIDHNRSPQHRGLWSELSRPLPTEQKQALRDDYYHPFRQAVGSWIQRAHEQGRVVVHLSVHSFTPILNGRVRQAEIGILYDSRRAVETRFGREWRKKLAAALPGLRIRLNTPYLGRSDCHMTGYRQSFTSADYLGIELEINQALLGDEHNWRLQQAQIAMSFRENLRSAFKDQRISKTSEVS